MAPKMGYQKWADYVQIAEQNGVALIEQNDGYWCWADSYDENFEPTGPVKGCFKTKKQAAEDAVKEIGLE